MNKQPQIYLVCGSGGVGKTTVSAAMGLKFSKQGKKVIVLTIDPARRLADALGISELDDTPRLIQYPAAKKNSGELWAMMINTKRTFDRLVEKYASSLESEQRIKGNRLYQHMSNMMAGTQEYMAIERLYEIYQTEEYDVIIIDTPPMQNAIDFLVAPQKMMHIIRDSMLHILLKPSMSLGKSGLGLLEKGAKQILKAFDRITGFAFLQDLSEMLIAFQDMLEGFETRAQQIRELLLMPSSHFTLVLTTHEHALNEAERFTTLLKKLEYHLEYIVFNRVYHGQSHRAKELEGIQKKLKKHYGKSLSDLLMQNYLRYLPLIKRDTKRIKDFPQVSAEQQCSQIPLFLSDVHDIKSLEKISNRLEIRMADSLPTNHF
jgi:anion-transporting  ArsA/GET3 family ATPase